MYSYFSQVFATNPPHHSYEVNAQSLKRTDVVRYAGTKIANFCQGYKTIYAHRLASGNIQYTIWSKNVFNSPRKRIIMKRQNDVELTNFVTISNYTKNK